MRALRQGSLQFFLCLSLLTFNSFAIANPVDMLFKESLERSSKNYRHLTAAEEANIQEYYFDQQVDHDNPAAGKFKQRYFLDESVAMNDDSPVFLYLCGELECSKKFLGGYIRTLAEKYHAKLVAFEHRYYGKSQPRQTLSTADLKFLTTDAVLKDFAALQKDLTTGLRWKGKWIVFGGSYAGSLAAYYRAKYPHMVVGALASSAPVKAQENAPEFDAHITSVVDATCAANMRAATREVEGGLANKDNMLSIKKMFQAEAIENDIDFLSFIAEVGTIAVQYGEKNRFCRMIRDSKTPLQGYATTWRLIRSVTGLSPVMLTPQGARSERLEDHNHFVGFRQWYYQMCTEYGYWQPAHTDANQSTRSALLTLNYYQNICQRLFGIPSEPKTNHINTNYYQPLLQKTTSQIFLTNGAEDPWSLLSITPKNGNNANENLTTILIDGKAHCSDLPPPREQDSADLKSARQRFDEAVNNWIA